MTSPLTNPFVLPALDRTATAGSYGRQKSIGKREIKPMKLRLYHIVWVMCIILAAIFFLFAVPRQPADTITLANTTAIAGAEGFGGPFTLTDHNGNPVTEKSWPDKYLILYFGFTFCPDVCPLGLTTIANALDKLPDDTQQKIQPLFITVDPQRDTADVLKQYVPLFNPSFIGLTGTDTQIDHVKKLYKIYAEKDGDGKEYMINHSAFTYLIAPNGELVGLYAHETSAEDMAKNIRSVIAD